MVSWKQGDTGRIGLEAKGGPLDLTAGAACQPGQPAKAVSQPGQTASQDRQPAKAASPDHNVLSMKNQKMMKTL